MTYEKFIRELKKKLKKCQNDFLAGYEAVFYNDGFSQKTTNESDFVKDTDVLYENGSSDTLAGDFVAIRKIAGSETAIICRQNIKYLYDEYNYGGWEWIEEIFRQNLDVGFREGQMICNMNDFEAVKDNLIVCLLNFPKNREKLDGFVYREIGDIAQVLYIRISYDDNNDMLTTFKVFKCYFDQWDLDKDMIWDLALANSCRFSPPRIYTSLADIYNMTEERGVFMADDANIKAITDRIWVPLLTTYPSINGAVSIFYPGVADKIAKMCDKDYYVGFSSIHEARIHPVGSIDPDHIRDNVKNTWLKWPDIALTKEVFRYYTDERQLRVE